MKKRFLNILTVLLFTIITPSTVPQNFPPKTQETVTNPVAPVGNDPWVIQKDGWYFYCYSWDGAIRVHKARKLQDAVQFAGQVVWQPEVGKPWSKELWAPELHFLRGRWYIYFAADDGRNENHRMYVLEGETADSQGKYVLRGKLAATPDKWAIDGSVLEYKGQLYFIWSGWEGDKNGCQNLYIARMKNPVALEGKRAMISTPEHDWERNGKPLINEGPTVLKYKERAFIIYSASGSWANDYCLGQLTLNGDNPMDPHAWVKKPTPVFVGTQNVISPGHASFTRSPDGTENWIVYHAARKRNAGWDRNTRIQRFTFDTNGNPVFGEPVPEHVAIPAPSDKRAP
jgi:GH43 family beta-xylosidase